MKKNSGNKADGAAKKSKPTASPKNSLKGPAAPPLPAPVADSAASTPTQSSKEPTRPKATSAKLNEGKAGGTRKSPAKKRAPAKSTATDVPVKAASTVVEPSIGQTSPPPANKSAPAAKPHGAPSTNPTVKAALEHPKLESSSSNVLGKSAAAASSTQTPAQQSAHALNAPVPKEFQAKPESKAKPGKRPSRSAEAPRPEVKIPTLLLEGDLPPSPSISGPGARYALAPQPVVHTPPPTGGELPEAYGTGRVFLAARDPHWLYVSWDFTSDQQSKYNAQSRDRHLIIRVFTTGQVTPAVPEVHVHPESKNWFVHVPFSETSYFAEIGFYDAAGIWRRAALSSKTLTPSDAPSKDLSAEFATIPVEVTFQQVVEAVQQFVVVTKNEPLLEAVAQASAAQREHLTAPAPHRDEPAVPQVSKTRIGPAPELPRHAPPLRQQAIEPLPIQINPADEWTEEQTVALSRLIHIDSFRRVWMGSMEITELVRRQLEEEVASIAAAKRKRPAVALPGALSEQENISSPAGGEFQKPGKFWFKVNAELIIYGATEPDAKVTIADRLIKLRPDGTFSFRFSLPDGRYQLPATAISADDQEGREARLEFSRSTDYRGHVEAHPQDAALRSPRPEHLE